MTLNRFLPFQFIPFLFFFFFVVECVFFFCVFFWFVFCPFSSFRFFFFFLGRWMCFLCVRLSSVSIYGLVANLKVQSGLASLQKHPHKRREMRIANIWLAIKFNFYVCFHWKENPIYYNHYHCHQIKGSDGGETVVSSCWVHYIFLELIKNNHGKREKGVFCCKYWVGH